MDKRAFQRKVVLVSGLIGAVYASFFHQEDSQGYQTAPSTVPAPLAAPSLAYKVEVRSAEAADFEEAEAGGDPFAPRGWAAPAPQPGPVRVVTEAPHVAAVTVPEGLPPLPFQFVGRMADGEEQVVYLGRGDQVVVARSGEPLDSAYKVLSIQPNRIEFEHVATGQKQSLQIAVREN